LLALLKREQARGLRRNGLHDQNERPCARHTTPHTKSSAKVSLG